MQCTWYNNNSHYINILTMISQKSLECPLVYAASNAFSLPFLWNATVSSPPPMHLPLMNTLGTVRAPVIFLSSSCKLAQSSRLFISRTSKSSVDSSPESMYFFRTLLALAQEGQEDFENTMTFLPLIFSWIKADAIFGEAEDYEAVTVFGTPVLPVPANVKTTMT